MDVCVQAAEQLQERAVVELSPRDTVSLVITCFNQGRFLAEAIDSALAQRRAFDQIVVVDDGSDDDTAAVAAHYPQIEYIHQENRGLAAARNTGLERAKGTFVLFLDADDRLVPDAVSAGLTCFAQNPCVAFVYGRYRELTDRGLTAPASTVHPHAHDTYGDLLRFNFIRMHATVMYRRSTIRALGGFDATLRASEDYDLYLRVARAHSIAAHDVVVAHYRKHGDNMSLDARLMLRSTLRVLKRHRPRLRGDGTHRKHYRDGLRNWQLHFGTKLGAHLIKGVRPGVSRTRLLSDALFALVRTPRALLKHRAVAYQTVGSSALSRFPAPLRRRLAALLGIHYRPPVGRAQLGDLEAVEPLCRDFGFGRGTPVDRYYIERFLERNASCIRGRVLEVGPETHAARFGAECIRRVDVRDGAIDPTLPRDAFDCILFTQSLHQIWDVRAALRMLHRALAPGGSLLLTVPGTISQVERGEAKSTWYWGFGPSAMEKLFAEAFASPLVTVDVHGNALASVGFLEGIAAEELPVADLDARDEQYPLLITVCATRPGVAEPPCR